MDKPSPLADQTIAFLGEGSEVVEYAPEERILTRGDAGRAFHVVLVGEVEIRLESGVNLPLPLTRLGPGASFGEMALLRRAPVSADVVSVGRTRILEVPRDSFLAALEIHESLRAKVLHRLATNLGSTNEEALQQFRRAQAFATLAKPGDQNAELIATSGRMTRILKKLDAAADKSESIWIVGESGSGRSRLAHELHRRSSRREGPLLLVDCKALPRDEATDVLFGSSNHESTSQAVELGAVHLAHGGTLVLRNADQLDTSVLERAQQYQQLHRQEGPDVRWIFTGHKAMENSGSLPDRSACLVVEVPPLRDRPQDVLDLARSHLTRFAPGESIPVLTKDAERALLSLPYSRRNVGELHDVIELAARCAEDGEIRAEHIFHDSGDRVGGPKGVELSQFRTWIRRYGIEGIRIFTLVGFAVSLLLLLVAPATRLARGANGVVWGLWEPVVFALFFLLGPVWCTICPLSTAARLSKRIASTRAYPPPFLKRSSTWLSALGFLLIVWSARAFQMTSNPRATGWFLAVLMVLAVGFAILYRREVWCRYLCPLGRLASALSPVSALRVAATPSVCTSQCTHHRCFKGSKEAQGCSVFHHPVASGEAFQCKLCLDCLRSCPHGSTQIVLRPPIAGVWHIGPTSAAIAPFATALFLLIPVLLAAQQSPRLDRPLTLGLVGIIAVVSGLALGTYLRPWILREPDSGSAAPEQAAFALLLLAWGPMMAYQLANVPVVNSLRLVAANSETLSRFLPPDGISLLLLGQLLFVASTALLFLLAMSKIMAGLKAQKIVSTRWGWWSLGSLATLHTSTCIALVLGLV